MADHMSIDKESTARNSTNAKEDAGKVAAGPGSKKTVNGSVEVIKEESEDSMDSSHDAEQGPAQNNPEGQDPPKRKGGRRPVSD